MKVLVVLCLAVAALAEQHEQHEQMEMRGCDLLDKNTVHSQWMYIMRAGEYRFEFNLALWKRLQDHLPEAKVMTFGEVKGTEVLPSDLRRYIARVVGAFDSSLDVLNRPAYLQEHLKHLRQAADKMGLDARVYKIVADEVLQEVESRLSSCYAHNAWHCCVGMIRSEILPGQQDDHDVHVVEIKHGDGHVPRYQHHPIEDTTGDAEMHTADEDIGTTALPVDHFTHQDEEGMTEGVVEEVHVEEAEVEHTGVESEAQGGPADAPELGVLPETANAVEPAVLPEVQPEVLPEVQPEVLPEVQPEVLPEVQPEVLPEVEPEVLPEVNEVENLEPAGSGRLLRYMWRR